MIQPLPIKAITFDLDDTLWDVWSVIDRAEQLLQDWLAEHYPRIPAQFTSVELRDLCGVIASEQPEIAHDRTALRKKSLQRAARHVDYSEFNVDVAFAVFFAARNAVELFAEVRPVLERLAQRYVLASLSNGNADVQIIGLDDVLTFSLNAIDVGAAKPAAPMFKAACQRLVLQPEQIVHVGDDPVLDVRGAAEAGFRTVWVNRNGQNWSEESRADAEIGSLDELETVLALWNTRTD